MVTVGFNFTAHLLTANKTYDVTISMQAWILVQTFLSSYVIIKAFSKNNLFSSFIDSLAKAIACTQGKESVRKKSIHIPKGL